MMKTAKSVFSLMVSLTLGVTACGEGKPPAAAQQIQVDCAADGVELGTGAVNAVADGVHFVIDNREPAERHVYFRAGDSQTTHLAPTGTSTFVATHPPGEWKIICSPLYIYPQDNAAWATLDVLDPDNHWIGYDLPCEHPMSTHPDYQEFSEGGLPTGTPGDPLALAKTEIGSWFTTRQGDELKPAGYPQSSPRLFQVIRDQDVVAITDYRSDGKGGWFFGSVTWCEEDS